MGIVTELPAFPFVTVAGLSEPLSVPVSAAQTKELINVASKVPFGKGEKVIQLLCPPAQLICGVDSNSYVTVVLFLPRSLILIRTYSHSFYIDGGGRNGSRRLDDPRGQRVIRSHKVGCFYSSTSE